MKISRIIFSFPGKMAKGFLYRMYQKYIFRSVSPVAIFWFFGVIFMGWGGLWGAAAWYESIVTRIPATTGTVILALMPLLFGWALILQAVVLDVQDVGESIIFDYEDESLN